MDIRRIIASYDATTPLSEASTIPSTWYLNPDLADLERKSVFSNSWQFAARVDQLLEPGRYVTSEIAGEPIVLVRGSDNVLRGFFNVCRHHAAAVMTQEAGQAASLQCPYHGWTYSLDGQLKSAPDLGGVCNFDRGSTGLLSIGLQVWNQWVFVRLEENETSG